MTGIEIAALAGAGLQGGSSGAGQYYQRRFQQQSQKESYNLTRRETYQSLVRGYGTLLTRQQEEREALAFGAEDANRQAAQAIGLVSALAGAGGISGNSLVAQLQDIGRRRLEQDQAALRQQQFRDRQAKLEALGLRDQGYQRLLAATGEPIQPFNPISAIGGGVQGGVAGGQLAGMF